MTDSESPVELVRRRVAGFGLAVREVPRNTSTAESAADALNTTVSAIVKSLLFYAGETPVLVLVAGDRKLDKQELASELGVERVRLAKPIEVTSVTGFAIGGVPPVGHPQPIRTLLDRTLFRHEIVYAAAGSSNAIFEVTPAQLAEISRAELTDATG